MTNDHGKKVNLKSCSCMRSLLNPMVCSLSWYIRHWGIWGPSCVTNSCFIFLPHLPKEWRSRSHEYDFDYAHLSRRCAPVCSQINDMLSFPKIDSYIIIYVYVTRTLSIVPRKSHFNQTMHTLVLDLESFSANEEYWNISLKADVSVSLIAWSREKFYRNIDGRRYLVWLN